MHHSGKNHIRLRSDFGKDHTAAIEFGDRFPSLIVAYISWSELELLFRNPFKFARIQFPNDEFSSTEL